MEGKGSVSVGGRGAVSVGGRGAVSVGGRGSVSVGGRESACEWDSTTPSDLPFSEPHVGELTLSPLLVVCVVGTSELIPTEDG